jgi:putative membrane protein
MTTNLHPALLFALRWTINTLALWVASYLFVDISFTNAGALWVSGLLLGFANAIIRPVLLILTLPLSVFTLGFFVLVINALMLLLVAWLVPGFSVAGFWTGFFVALFISVFGFFTNLFIGMGHVKMQKLP